MAFSVPLGFMAVVLVSFLSPCALGQDSQEPDRPPPAAAKTVKAPAKATISFSGRKGEPIEVVDEEGRLETFNKVKTFKIRIVPTGPPPEESRKGEDGLRLDLKRELEARRSGAGRTGNVSGRARKIPPPPKARGASGGKGSPPGPRSRRTP